MKLGKGDNTKFLVPGTKTKCETAFQHILREAINAPYARKLATVAKIVTHFAHKLKKNKIGGKKIGKR